MAFSTTPDWFHVDDDEDVVWQSRPHPIEMGNRLPIGVGIAALGTLLAAWSATDGISTVTLLALVIGVGGAVVALARYLVWTNTRYVITDSELYKKRGVISRNVTQFRLDRIQNTSLDQSGIGRLLGYGDLTVYTAGSGDPELTFERVPRPERASSVLSDQLARQPDTDAAV